MSETISTRELSDLIGAIYDCALDPGLWDKALAGMMDAFETKSAILNLRDIHHSRFSIADTSSCKTYGNEQRNYLAGINDDLLSEDISADYSCAEPYVLSSNSSSARPHASAHLQHQLRPHGLVDTLHLFVRSGPNQIAGFGFARHEEQGHITDREVELARMLLPHLYRVLTIASAANKQAVARQRIMETLDGLKCGVVLIDPQAVILHANRSAWRMIANGYPIKCERNLICFLCLPAAEALQRTLAQIAQRKIESSNLSVAVRLTEANAPTILAYILPLADPSPCLWGKTAAAAIFICPAQDQQGLAENVANAYGLTLAETRVLASLLGGETLADTATTLRIAPTTARTHLQSIFGKTTVDRQTELMRLAMQISSPIHFSASEA